MHINQLLSNSNHSVYARRASAFGLDREPSPTRSSESSRTWSGTRPKTLLIRNIPNFDAGSPVFGNLGRTRASRCPLLGQGGATGSGGRSTGYDGSPVELGLQTKAKSSRCFDTKRYEL